MNKKILISLRKDMRRTMQFHGQSLLDHGFSVARHFKDMHDHFKYGTKLQYEWKFPVWASTKSLWSQIPELRNLYKYQIYHDCGKLQFGGVEGHRKLSDHAYRSFEMWRSIGGDGLVASMMLHDMDIHLMSADQMDGFADLPYAAALILTGLSEIHANAVAFGGMESTSFKSKWKQIDRRAKKFINLTTNKESEI